MNSVPWSSLEIAKLVVAGATPLMIFVAGIWLQQTLKRIEQLQWVNRKLVDRRLQAYDELAPLLNDYLCFFAYVGGWKELTPRQMVESKRILDKRMHLAAPLFTVQLLDLYNRFIGLCFQTYNAMGADAKLRTRADDRRPYCRPPWDPTWDALFAPGEKVDPRTIIAAYEALISAMAREIGVGLSEPKTLLAFVNHKVLIHPPRKWWQFFSGGSANTSGSAQPEHAADGPEEHDAPLSHRRR